MENINNQIDAEVILINSDIDNILNEDKVDKALIVDDIEYVIKKRKIDMILLDKENAKDNLKKFLERRKQRLDGEKYEVYNSIA